MQVERKSAHGFTVSFLVCIVGIPEPRTATKVRGSFFMPNKVKDLRNRRYNEKTIEEEECGLLQVSFWIERSTKNVYDND